MVCVVLTVLAGAVQAVSLPSDVPFLVAAAALAMLASLVGRSVDALGDRLGAGATGLVQSSLGNLPELFVCLFALHDGLYDVVRAALVGSVLANILLVLGLAFVVGGLRHGTQTFATGRARTISLLLVLSVAVWMIPSLTSALHTPAAGHERALSIVTALQPAMEAVHISQAFAGLVVVSIAGNAVENVVGVQLAARNQADYALSVILQSPLQIALVLAPVLVLVAPLVGASFTLVLSPLLVASLVMASIVAVLVVNDGESTWLEGATLIVLYCLIATSFWWG